MKAPFPYFGGKMMIADKVWAALGNPRHYIEPFFGSGAVLLAREKYNPITMTETVNDKDGHICNVWRALQADPDGVAKLADWPVNHADLSARKRVINASTENMTARLIADDTYYDIKIAAYWIWAASCWIGSGLTRPYAMPNISNGGKGIHAIGKIPHISHGGKGIHAIGKMPHLSGGGMVTDPYNTTIYETFRKLSERLRYVRVVCGDWKQVCGGNWQDDLGAVGIFFDPPYSDTAKRYDNLYAKDSLSVAHEVRDWCLARGKLPTYKIVLAGYYEEHDTLLNHGWTVIKWKAGGGYGKIKGTEETGELRNRHREALFLSPYCKRDDDMFSALDNDDEPGIL